MVILENDLPDGPKRDLVDEDVKEGDKLDYGKGVSKMGNMGYCRFQNTVGDLEDCYDHIHDDLDDFSDEEKKARQRLIELCSDIVNDCDDEE